MTTPVKLKPAEGRTVTMPDGTDFPAEGDTRVPDLFIKRRIADGDLVIVPPGKKD